MNKNDNVPADEVTIPDPFAYVEGKRVDRMAHTTEERLQEIQKEFSEGFEFIKKYDRSVSIFGSARATPASPHWQKAYSIAQRIVKELGYAIVTGGGHGIMEAGNKGALDAGGVSIGLNITLPHEQTRNHYLSNSMEFYYFFCRKVILSFSAEAYLFFPGGFGTLDEFFELVTLIETRKIPALPLILIGDDFWKPLQTYIEEHLYGEHRAIDKKDMNLYHITENEDEILEIIKKATAKA